MTIKKFFESKEKLAIHCDTKEQANKLIQRFDQLGYKWVDGSCYTNFGYDRRICFDNKNCWASTDLYKKCNYKILEFEDIDDFKEVNMSNTIEINEFREKLDNVSKAIENLKKEFETLKEKIEEPNVGFEDDPIFLLSKEEYKKYKSKIPPIRCWWWLRTPGDFSNYAAFVYVSGNVDDHGHGVFSSDAIRPALKISSIKSLKLFTNNSFFALGATWKIIDEDLAISEMPIMFSRFDGKSNDYATSEVRKKLLDWYKERIEW